MLLSVDVIGNDSAPGVCVNCQALAECYSRATSVKGLPSQKGPLSPFCEILEKKINNAQPQDN